MLSQLRVDEARNAQDVRAFLASVATRFVEAEVTPAEIEANVKNQFGIDVDMRELEEAMRIKKEVLPKLKAAQRPEEEVQRWISTLLTRRS